MKQSAHSTDGYIEQVFDPDALRVAMVRVSVDVLVRALLGDEFYVMAPSDVADLRDEIIHTALVTAPPPTPTTPSSSVGRGRG